MHSYYDNYFPYTLKIGRLNKGSQQGGPRQDRKGISGGNKRTVPPCSKGWGIFNILRIGFLVTIQEVSRMSQTWQKREIFLGRSVSVLHPAPKDWEQT
jgi:hypothetical protein